MKTPCSLYKKLIDDQPGEHVYVHGCRTCGLECGPDWVERHWGSSDPVPDVHKFARANCPLRIEYPEAA